MKQKLKTMEFRDGPLANLIWELEIEAAKWCEGHCLYFSSCFDNPVFHLEEIEKCKKIPSLYKLYWKAKAKNISAISPLIVYKEDKI